MARNIMNIHAPPRGRPALLPGASCLPRAARPPCTHRPGRQTCPKIPSSRRSRRNLQWCRERWKAGRAAWGARAAPAGGKAGARAGVGQPEAGAKEAATAGGAAAAGAGSTGHLVQTTVEQAASSGAGRPEAFSAQDERNNAGTQRATPHLLLSLAAAHPSRPPQPRRAQAVQSRPQHPRWGWSWGRRQSRAQGLAGT